MTMKELGFAPLLGLLSNLLLLALTNCEPTTPLTAMLLAYKALLSSPMLAPATDAFAPILLLESIVLETFRIAPLAVAATPLPLPNIIELLTAPTPPPATSIALLVREMFTRSAE